MNSLATKIKRFLQDGYFAEGVALLQRCDVAHTIKSQFQRYLGSPFVPTHVEKALQDQLRRVLISMPLEQRLADPGEEAEGPGSGSVKLRGPVSGSLWGPLFAGRSEVPAEVWELYQQAIELHKEHSYLHALLCDAALGSDSQKTRQHAVKIMETVIPALDRIYDAARAWGETGKLPTGPTRNQMLRDLNDKYKLYQNLKIRICKKRKFLKENHVHVRGTIYRPMTQFDRAKYEEEILKLSEELAILGQELEIR